VHDVRRGGSHIGHRWLNGGFEMESGWALFSTTIALQRGDSGPDYLMSAAHGRDGEYAVYEADTK